MLQKKERLKIVTYSNEMDRPRSKTRTFSMATYLVRQN